MAKVRSRIVGHRVQVSKLTRSCKFDLLSELRPDLDYRMTAKVGDTLPDATLFEGAPDKKVKIKDVFKGKKGILFGVPGAFTPGCSKTHLPGYVSDSEKFKKLGVEVVVCVAVNDAFVMSAWGEANQASGKVRMLADTQMELTKGLGLTLDAEGMLGTKRCKRFSAVIVDNTIKSLNLEADGTGLSCSLSNEIVKQLESLK